MSEVSFKDFDLVVDSCKICGEDEENLLSFKVVEEIEGDEFGTEIVICYSCIEGLLIKLDDLEKEYEEFEEEMSEDDCWIATDEGE